MAYAILYILLMINEHIAVLNHIYMHACICNLWFLLDQLQSVVITNILVSNTH